MLGSFAISGSPVLTKTDFAVSYAFARCLLAIQPFNLLLVPDLSENFVASQITNSALSRGTLT